MDVLWFVGSHDKKRRSYSSSSDDRAVDLINQSRGPAVSAVGCSACSSGETGQIKHYPELKEDSKINIQKKISRAVMLSTIWEYFLKKQSRFVSARRAHAFVIFTSIM